MNQVVLVTGASSGLGKSIAFHLHKLGYTVYGTSRNPEQYSETFPFTLVQLDVTKKDSITQLIQTLKEKEHRIDVLINNAGVGITGPVEETSLDAMRANFETNFFGPLAMIQAVLPIMRKHTDGASSTLLLLQVTWAFLSEGLILPPKGRLILSRKPYAWKLLHKEFEL